MSAQTPESIAAKIVTYLECPQMNDHEPGPTCWKCAQMREGIAAILRAEAHEEDRFVGATVVEATQSMIRASNTRQRAAEIARGRVPKVGDKIQRRRDPIGIVKVVGDSWCEIDFAGYPGGATRENIAVAFDYLDETAT